jgi:hypothetical protein
MMQKIAVLLILSGISFTVLAQNEAPKKFSRRPDIPGTFVLEFGFNQDMSGPDDFSIGFFGSRSVNIYYQYDMRILKSKFSFVPGIGLSLERFKLKYNRIIDYDPADLESILITPAADTDFEDARKSMLVTNYIDVPLEIKYSTNPDDPARSFKISVGGRVGFMYDSFNKIKYKENGELKKIKNKEDFNLTKFRYGLTARIGVGNFSLFGYYNLTPLFEKGKGLSDRFDDNTSVKNDFSTLTIGISLASF